MTASRLDFALWRDRIVLLVVALLPWQARYIRIPGSFRGVPWEPGTIGIFALEVLILIALLAHLLSEVKRQTSNVKSYPSWLRIWAVFILFAGVSTYWAAYPAAALFGWVHLVVGFSLACLLAVSRFSIRQFLGAFLVGATANAVVGLLQFLFQSIPGSTLLGIAGQSAETPGVSVIETAGGRTLRAYGLLPHPNIFGAYAAAACAAALALVSDTADLLKRRLVMAAGFLSAAALAASFSRAAWIASAFVLLVSVRGLRHAAGPVERKRLWKALLIMAVGFGVVLLMALPAARARVTATGRLETKSFDERHLSVIRGVQLFALYPAFGVGLGNMVPAAYEHAEPRRPVWEYLPAHLVPVITAAELGFFGLMLVLGATFFWFSSLRFHLPFARTLADGAALVLPLIPIVEGLFDHWPVSTFSGILLTGFCFGLSLKTQAAPAGLTFPRS